MSTTTHAGRLPGIEMLSAKQIRASLGVCDMTLRRMQARDASMPRPIKIAGSTRRFWPKIEFESWLANHRPAAEVQS